MRAKAVILVILGLLFPGNAEAQKLYAVIVAATDDQSLNRGAQRNLQKVNAFLQAAQSLGGISTSIEEVSGNRFTCRNISEAVQRVKDKIIADDAVVFYYAGHGYRYTDTPTKFPIFDCTQPGDMPNFGLSSVVQRLSANMRPRLLLAISDSCNVQIGFRTPPAEVGVRAAPGATQVGLRQLFLNHRGTLTMSASQPGEVAWYWVTGQSNLLGGFFTNRLMNTIDANISIRAQNVMWEDIARDATRTIVVTQGGISQTPQYEKSVDFGGKPATQN